MPVFQQPMAGAVQFDIWRQGEGEWHLLRHQQAAGLGPLLAGVLQGTHFALQRGGVTARQARQGRGLGIDNFLQQEGGCIGFPCRMIFCVFILFIRTKWRGDLSFRWPHRDDRWRTTNRSYTFSMVSTHASQL